MESGWRRVLDISLVMIVIAIVLLIIFASLNYGFTYLKKQLSGNIVSSYQQAMFDSINNSFRVLLTLVFVILLCFILLQLFFMLISIIKKHK
jgi:hypothetical protein